MSNNNKNTWGVVIGIYFALTAVALVIKGSGVENPAIDGVADAVLVIAFYLLKIVKWILEMAANLIETASEWVRPDFLPR